MYSVDADYCYRGLDVAWCMCVLAHRFTVIKTAKPTNRDAVWEAIRLALA